MQQCLARGGQMHALQPTFKPSGRQPFKAPMAPRQQQRHRKLQQARVTAAPAKVQPEEDIHNMSAFLDSLKWDSNGLVVAIAQHVDTGEVLMQAFADRNAVLETLQTG
jgi:hypothetical protein